MCIKWMPLRYFLTFIFAIIAPPIIYCLAIVLSPFALLFCLFCYIPIYICESCDLRCRNRFSKFCRLFFVFTFYIPVVIALASIVLITGGVCILIAASILLPLYYPFMIILMLVMLSRHCNILPKSK